MHNPRHFGAAHGPGDTRWLVRLAREHTREEDRLLYVRPLYFSLLGLTAGQLALFALWRLVLFPSGPILAPLVWTVVLCGLGMGALLGVAIDLVVTGRWYGVRAVLATTALATMLVGVGCNVLCFAFDRAYVHLFGSDAAARAFLVGGLVASTASGAIIGALLHTTAGQALAARMGL